MRRPRRRSALSLGVGPWPRGALGDRCGEEPYGVAQPSALGIGPRLRSAHRDESGKEDPHGGGETLDGLSGLVHRFFSSYSFLF